MWVREWSSNASGFRTHSEMACGPIDIYIYIYMQAMCQAAPIGAVACTIVCNVIAREIAAFEFRVKTKPTIPSCTNKPPASELLYGHHKQQTILPLLWTSLCFVVIPCDVNVFIRWPRMYACAQADNRDRVSPAVHRNVATDIVKYLNCMPTIAVLYDIRIVVVLVCASV